MGQSPELWGAAGFTSTDLFFTTFDEQNQLPDFTGDGFVDQYPGGHQRPPYTG